MGVTEYQGMGLVSLYQGTGMGVTVSIRVQGWVPL